MLLSGRPGEGLLTLSSGLRNQELVDADATVWMFGDLDGHATGDVLTASVTVRDPGGLGRARLGRFILSTGAIRPVHMDGIYMQGKLPSGTGLELFLGSPVVPEFGSRAFDWLTGGRLSQQLWKERVVLGFSYIHQRDAGMVANEEAGADMLIQLSDAVSLRGVLSWDVTFAGLAAGELSASYVNDGTNVRAFAERRVASRLLLATSLFSVISDSASNEAGVDGYHQLFPRLGVGGRAAMQWIDVDDRRLWGYRLSARARLDLDAEGDGQATLQASRRGGLDAGYSGVYLAAEEPVTEHLRAHAGVELVAADRPGDSGAVWPHVNVGARFTVTDELSLAGALMARATPLYRNEVLGLLRLTYEESLLP